MAGASAVWLVVGFPPLLRGADGSPHSTPVGFPPGARRQGDIMVEMEKPSDRSCKGKCSISINIVILLAKILLQEIQPLAPTSV